MAAQTDAHDWCVVVVAGRVVWACSYTMIGVVEVDVPWVRPWPTCKLAPDHGNNNDQRGVRGNSDVAGMAAVASHAFHSAADIQTRAPHSPRRHIASSELNSAAERRDMHAAFDRPYDTMCHGVCDNQSHLHSQVRAFAAVSVWQMCSNRARRIRAHIVVCAVLNMFRIQQSCSDPPSFVEYVLLVEVYLSCTFDALVSSNCGLQQPAEFVEGFDNRNRRRNMADEPDNPPSGTSSPSMRGVQTRLKRKQMVK